jgi:hypothetical protein
MPETTYGWPECPDDRVATIAAHAQPEAVSAARSCQIASNLISVSNNDDGIRVEWIVHYRLSETDAVR